MSGQRVIVFPGDDPVFTVCLEAEQGFVLPVNVTQHAGLFALLRGEEPLPSLLTEAQPEIAARVVEDALIVPDATVGTPADIPCWAVRLIPSLPEGLYRFVVNIQDPAVASAVVGDDVRGRIEEQWIIDVRSPSSVEERLFRHWRQAVHAESVEDWPRVLSETAALLQEYPESIEGLRLRAEGLARSGDNNGARAALRDARRIAREKRDKYASFRLPHGGYTEEDIHAWALSEGIPE